MKHLRKIDFFCRVMLLALIIAGIAFPSLSAQADNLYSPMYSAEVPEDTQTIDCDEGEPDINMTLYYDGDELVRTEKTGD